MMNQLLDFFFKQGVSLMILSFVVYISSKCPSNVQTLLAAMIPYFAHILTKSWPEELLKGNVAVIQQRQVCLPSTSTR